MINNKEIIFIASDQCGHCDFAKQKLKNKINNGEIRVLDGLKDKEGKAIADEYNINTVPSFIIRDKVTKIGETCNLSADVTKLICQNREVKL